MPDQVLVTCPCPCCGAEMVATEPARLIGLVSPTMREIVISLMRRPGEWICGDEIATHVYRNHRDGGPLNSRTVISLTIRRNRAAVEALGWDVVSKKGPGGGYMLQTRGHADA